MSTLIANDAHLIQSFDRLISRFPEDERTRSGQDFASLSYQVEDGVFESLFTADRMGEIWDLYFQMQANGIESTYQWLNNTIIPRKEELLGRRIVEIYPISVFESPLLDEVKEREQIALSLEQDQGILSDIKGCGKCGNEKTYVRVVQDRSADEGPSSVFTCPRCNTCWKEG